MTLEERRNKWQKRKEMRRKAALRKAAVRFVTVCSVLLMAANIVFFLSKPVKAKEEKPLIKYYTSVEIMPGDTLTSIAKEHMEGYSSVRSYIEEVKFMNQIQDVNDIKAGQKIHIPYYSTEIKE